MLSIEKLNVSVGDKKILKDFNLKIGKGEVHAIMGPNGSGKSTLSYVLAGKDGYEVDGKIMFKNENIIDLEADERAQKGIFLAFQYPIEIPGVFMNNFLKTSLNAVKKAKGQKEVDVVEFLSLVKQHAKKLGIKDEQLGRALNVGFSGGEKKRNEVLQLSLLEPDLAILDETDSGLDIDALKVVADGVNALRSPNRSFLIITHYQRLLDYIKPDFVHVMVNGTIVKTGCSKLAQELDKIGYKEFQKAI
jgi:Fe-S cluster assembly ATP-binding protein